LAAEAGVASATVEGIPTPKTNNQKGEEHMLKKLFVTAAAAAAVSVPFAGVAWADKPEDPGAGNQGVPDRATATVVDQLSDLGVDETTINTVLAASQSGNSGVVAPGSAYSTGAKVPGLNAPDGYGVALNAFYSGLGIPLTDPRVNPFDPGEPFGRTIPGSVTRAFTPGCAQHSSGVCLSPTP
jgi:hypothetical protein